MDRIQYDVLHSALIRIENKQDRILEGIISVTAKIDSLNEKTLVITDVDRKMEQLELDLANIKDEVNA